jgi:hypothetical protein
MAGALLASARYAATHTSGAFQLMVTSLVDQLPRRST